MKLIYLTLTALFFYTTGMAQQEIIPTLYPWLAKSGKFGYCDSTGKCIIKPRFDDALPFKNGYAIVSNKGRYGLIDLAEKTIISLKYPSAQFFNEGLFDLVVTKKEYNAWWRFWQWKLMPEFNILSTRSQGPFLVTKVPMATWIIRSLPNKKLLFRQKRKEGKADRSQYWKKDWYPDQHIPVDIQISSAGNILKVQENLFLFGTDHKPKKIAAHVLELINDTTALIYKGENYFKLDLTGKLLEKEPYTMQDKIRFQVDPNVTMYVKKQPEEMYPFSTISAFIFKGAGEKTYLFPDLSKPFPTHVQDYQRGDVSATAAEIMKWAVMIASVPNTKYFLVLSAFGENNKRKCLLLDSNGNWNTNIPAYEGLDQLLDNGDMLFTRGAIKGILTRDLEFVDFPLDNWAFPLSFSKGMYCGMDVVTKKYGIYDLSKQAWQVTPSYTYIGNEIVPGSCIYTMTSDDNGTRKEHYGLVDIMSNKVIAPPVYDMIKDDGRACVTENGQQIYFYINPFTGKEYREQ